MALQRIIPPDTADEFHAWPRSRRMGQDAGVEMTPLIDVTFLLLIFFMVTSSLAAQQAVALPEAVHGTAVNPEAATIITLVQPEGEDPTRIFLGDTQAEQGDVDSVRSWVEQGLAQGRTVVVVKAEGSVPAGQTRRVYQVIRQIEGVQLHIGVREKN